MAEKNLGEELIIYNEEKFNDLKYYYEQRS
jgi:hypothetical protein